MDRSNPYEAALEAYLQQQGLCYVAIDETRRAMLGDSPVKNLDFIVHGACGSRLLLDVKGRRFPGGPATKPRYVWENWATQDDVVGLRRWAQLFGPEATALFVFLYRLMPTIAVPPASPDLFRWRGEQYLLRAVAVEDYLQHMRVRSPKWGTVNVPTAAFRTLARPFRYFTHELRQQQPGEGQRDNCPGPRPSGRSQETPTDVALEDRAWTEDLEPALAATLAGAGEAGRPGA
jgi:hypothetical protein